MVRNVPEIVELVGSSDANQVLEINDQEGEEKAKSVLRSTFTKLMSASREMVVEVTSKLKNRLRLESEVC